MAVQKPLKQYRAKRTFARTPEPYGTLSSTTTPLFVIHKHDASHMHYDLRLALKGVLVSWAVPKGPSLNPAIKRLAIQTENHPLEYAQFEGVIPPDNYGAGTVMVWDIGTYTPLKITPDRIEVILHGKKLHGGFALIKTKHDKQWLLIKMNDTYANRTAVVTRQSTSALTGRSMRRIKQESTAADE